MNKIKKLLSRVLLGIMVGAIPASADTISWDGKGLDQNGQLNDVKCDAGDDPFGANQPYLLWVLTFGGGTGDSPVLHIGSNDYPMDLSPQKKNAKVFTPFYNQSSLQANAPYATFNVQRGGTIVLTISHGCPGGNTQVPEFPSIAFPIAGVIGLVVFFQYSKTKKE